MRYADLAIGPVPKGILDSGDSTKNAALVLVCSLIVHTLHVSLHQERAFVGASHQRFWSLAGGNSGTQTARGDRALAAAVYHIEQRSLFWPQRATEERKRKPRPQEATRKIAKKGRWDRETSSKIACCSSGPVNIP